MAPEILFEGARIITGDGSEPAHDFAMLVRDGQIVALGPAESLTFSAGTRRIQLQGKTIMPTIINPHCHAGYLRGATTDASNFSRENVLDHLRRFVYYGVSATMSLGTDRDDIEIAIRNDQRAGILDDPEFALLMSASNGIAAPTPGGGNGGAFFAPEAIREASTPEEARKVVREVLSKNPDAIKFWVDDRNGTKTKFGPEIYRVIIDEAHRAGTKAIAHIYDLEDAKGVIRAGADGIAHMVREPGPDPDLLTLLREKSAFVFTSMSIQKAILDGKDWLDSPALAETTGEPSRNAFKAMFARADDSVVEMMRKGYRVLESGLTKYVDAGVRVLLSGDTGVMAQFPGFTEHRELAAMVEAGMSALEAIKAATFLPAEMLGLHDRGSLAPGKRADFIVLDADPLEAIANTLKISDVYISGTAIDRIKMRSDFESQALTNQS